MTRETESGCNGTLAFAGEEWIDDQVFDALRATISGHKSTSANRPIFGLQSTERPR
jgi:hypothetical protein